MMLRYPRWEKRRRREVKMLTSSILYSLPFVFCLPPDTSLKEEATLAGFSVPPNYA